MGPFGWCFIGAGTLAGKVARELTASGRHRIVSVYTRRSEACREFARTWDAVACDTAEAALACEGVEGVYIVTPHNAHFRYGVLALERGVPALIEKPLTIEAPDADRLIALARERGVYLSEAMWTWFGDTPYRVRDWVQSGVLGELTSVRATYCMMSAGYAPRVTDPRRGGGALLDVGVYPITYLYRIFGKPDKITCAGRLKNGIDLWEKLELTFGTLTAHVRVSIVDPLGLEELTIRGEKGRITVPRYHRGGTARLICPGGGEEFSGRAGLLNEFDRVAEEIRAGRTESAWVPHAATCDVMHIMDECRRQMGLTYQCE